MNKLIKEYIIPICFFTVILFVFKESTNHYGFTEICLDWLGLSIVQAYALYYKFMIKIR